MSESEVHFCLVLHAHQPTGNFDHVFRENLERCYEPLLAEIEHHPDVPVTLHYSGILLEWMEANEPAHCDRLRALVQRGQVELLGGGFGEPILVMLSDRDRARQIETMSEYLEERFGARPRGMWLSERVWEQSLAHDIAAAGLEYTLVDDSHFRLSGLRGDELRASYICEDRGSTVRIYPLSEHLRHLIPFQDLNETLQHLRSRADKEGTQLVVYGDDAEKFGGWPGTHQRVFREGWLSRFLSALEKNRSWIRMLTTSDALSLPPAGKVYLPDASYREMTEWALPTPARVEYGNLLRELGDLSGAAAPFFRGGSWRTFLSKYPEAGEMYGKMVDVSRRVALLPEGSDAKRAAEYELFRSQCNCAYWHGIFGGLYLPHLRFAVYRGLIRAENVVDRQVRQEEDWVDTQTTDRDRDGFREVILASNKLSLLIHPRRGGHLVEIDDREREVNITAGMTRRPEAYHSEVRSAVTADPNEGVASIHNRSAAKQKGLERLLIYDDHKREGLIDHFFAPSADLEAVARSEHWVEEGDFVERPYEVSVRPAPQQRAVILSRTGTVRTEGKACRVKLEKEARLRPGVSEFDVGYTIRNVGEEPLSTVFSVEFLLALLAGNAPDRRLFGDDRDLGPLASRFDLSGSTRVGARDEYLDLCAGFSFSRPASVWIFPVETVSHSEGGFESVYQSTVFLPRWNVSLDPGEEWALEMTHFLEPA